MRKKENEAKTVDDLRPRTSTTRKDESSEVVLAKIGGNELSSLSSAACESRLRAKKGGEKKGRFSAPPLLHPRKDHKLPRCLPGEWKAKKRGQRSAGHAGGKRAFPLPLIISFWQVF